MHPVAMGHMHTIFEAFGAPSTPAQRTYMRDKVLRVDAEFDLSRAHEGIAKLTPKKGRVGTIQIQIDTYLGSGIPTAGEASRENNAKLLKHK